jgi:hypothetical protein
VPAWTPDDVADGVLRVMRMTAFFASSCADSVRAADK